MRELDVLALEGQPVGTGAQNRQSLACLDLVGDAPKELAARLVSPAKGGNDRAVRS